MNPPPTSPATSTPRPTPLGGLKWSARSALPRFPPPVGNVKSPAKPTRSSDASIGPIDKLTLAEHSADNPAPLAPSLRYSVGTFSTPMDMSIGSATSNPAALVEERPCSLDQVMTSSKLRRSSSGSTLDTNPTPPFDASVTAPPAIEKASHDSPETGPFAPCQTKTPPT